MQKKYIVAGPFDGLFHVCYLVVGTKTYSSICCTPSILDAHEEADMLNGVNSNLGADLLEDGGDHGR